ncbi:MAG: RNA polymerase sporulation sigma factor SigH [Fimbriimonadaceae bacterium]|nr:RNA polymerase sporulation sigma factor SigH [Fimbriimonadaceae bacterium]
MSECGVPWSSNSLSRLLDHDDITLVRRAQAGDREGERCLLDRYRGLVRSTVQKYFLVGAEREDLLQVGMIGLWQAITDFREDRNNSFKSFAHICIKRQIITAVKAATRQKQLPLNTSLSLDTPLNRDSPEHTLGDVLPSEASSDPADHIIFHETKRVLEQRLHTSLSEFEMNVLLAYKEGRSYRQMADQLRCTVKSIDNALSRVKRKLSALTTEIWHA